MKVFDNETHRTVTGVRHIQCRGIEDGTTQCTFTGTNGDTFEVDSTSVRVDDADKSGMFVASAQDWNNKTFFADMEDAQDCRLVEEELGTKVDCTTP